MTDTRLIEAAAILMRADAHYLDDARTYAGNTVVGSLLATICDRPRWATEVAVAAALERIEASVRPAPQAEAGLQSIAPRHRHLSQSAFDEIVRRIARRKKMRGIDSGN